MKEVVLKAIPTFRITDYAKALAFYVDKMGFEIDWEHRFGPNDQVYMQVSCNGLVVHLSGHERFKIGTVVYVNCNDLNQFCTTLNARLKKTKHRPIITEWGTLQLEAFDPFGNLLRFNQEL